MDIDVECANIPFPSTMPIFPSCLNIIVDRANIPIPQSFYSVPSCLSPFHFYPASKHFDEKTFLLPFKAAESADKVKKSYSCS